MIKVVELTCTEDLHLNRRGTFTAGKTYYSKISKSGQNIIVLSNEGKWQPVRSLKMSSGSDSLQKHFEYGGQRFFDNKSILNDFMDVNNPLEEKWRKLCREVSKNVVYVKDNYGKVYRLDNDLDVLVVVGHKTENILKFKKATQDEIDKYHEDVKKEIMDSILRQMDLKEISVEELVTYNNTLKAS